MKILWSALFHRATIKSFFMDQMSFLSPNQHVKALNGTQSTNPNHIPGTSSSSSSRNNVEPSQQRLESCNIPRKIGVSEWVSSFLTAPQKNRPDVQKLKNSNNTRGYRCFTKQKLHTGHRKGWKMFFVPGVPFILSNSSKWGTKHTSSI